MGLHPGQVAFTTGPHTDKQPFAFKLITPSNLELPVSLMCMSYDCGSKPGTRAEQNLTCKISCSEATVLTSSQTNL